MAPGKGHGEIFLATPSLKASWSLLRPDHVFGRLGMPSCRARSQSPGEDSGRHVNISSTTSPAGFRTILITRVLNDCSGYPIIDRGGRIQRNLSAGAGLRGATPARDCMSSTLERPSSSRFVWASHACELCALPESERIAGCDDKDFPGAMLPDIYLNPKG